MTDGRLTVVKSWIWCTLTDVEKRMYIYKNHTLFSASVSV